jgi:phosphoglycolate phosphatase-like HAD superfamily hydrolase
LNSGPSRYGSETSLDLQAFLFPRRARPSCYFLNDKDLDAYRDGKVGLADHVDTLAAHAVPLPSSLLNFQKAAKFEKTIDFKQAEQERSEVVEQLVQRLSEQQLSDLAARSAAFKAGRLSRATFYDELKSLCEKNRIPWNSYAALQSYLSYVLLAQSVRMDRLQNELSLLEKNVANRLARTHQEIKLLEEVERFHLLTALTHFTLTPTQWAEYKAQASLKGSWPLDPSRRDIYEKFYQEAEKRDKAMSTGVLEAMASAKTQSAILVAGGFHGTGIKKLLLDEGVAVIEFVPRITKVEAESGSSYLSVFSQDKTPLEQLFSAEKLFVAKTPMAPTTAFQMAGEVSAVEATQKAEGMTPKAVVPFFLAENVLARIKAITLKSTDAFTNVVFHFSDRSYEFTYTSKGNKKFDQKPVLSKKAHRPQMAREALFFLGLPAGVLLGHLMGMGLTWGPLFLAQWMGGLATLILSLSRLVLFGSAISTVSLFLEGSYVESGFVPSVWKKNLFRLGKLNLDSPEAHYGWKLNLRKIKASTVSKMSPAAPIPLPNEESIVQGPQYPNTLRSFWQWWNRIRRNSIESRAMVTRQAPWESYWLTVLAGMTVPVLMFFHLSPLWAGAWGAVWGLAHVAGTFDKRLNPIGGYEALWPSLAKAAVGTLWVALYAWGLEGLLGYSPLAEAMARLALFDGSGSLLFTPLSATLSLSSILGFIPQWIHRKANNALANKHSIKIESLPAPAPPPKIGRLFSNEEMEKAISLFNILLEQSWLTSAVNEVNGARRLLGELSASRVPLYVASGAPRSIIDAGLARAGMREIPSGHINGAPRPKSATIREAQEGSNGVVIMIGDAELDMTEAARVAGSVGIQRMRAPASADAPIFHQSTHAIRDYSTVHWDGTTRSLTIHDEKSNSEITIVNVGAVVFDFDGTLIDSHELVADTFQIFARSFFSLTETDKVATKISEQIWRSMDGNPADEIIPAILSELMARGYAPPKKVTNAHAIEIGKEMMVKGHVNLAPLWSAWDQTMARGGVFRYTLDKLNKRFLGRFHAVYNPDRAGKRPAQMESTNLLPPFNPNGFHFEKIDPRELLAEDVKLPRNGDSISVDVVANVNPLERYHVLFTPERSHRHPQRFTPLAVKSALRLLDGDGGETLKVGYNSVGAFASIPHLHLQGIQSEDPLPVETAFSGPNKTKLGESDGIAVWELKEWPIPVFVVTGKDETRLVTTAVSLADHFQEKNQPFNALLARDPLGRGKSVFIFPRKLEGPTKSGTGIAWYECTGRALFAPVGDRTADQSLAVYQNATNETIAAEMAEYAVEDEALKETEAFLKGQFTAGLPLDKTLITRHPWVGLKSYFFPPSSNSQGQTQPRRIVGFFPSFSARSSYLSVPDLFGQGVPAWDRVYEEAAVALKFLDPSGEPDLARLSFHHIPEDLDERVRALFRNFVLFNLALSVEFQEEIKRSEWPIKVEAFTGLSAGILTSVAASGSLSVGDAAKVADYFWLNVIQVAKQDVNEDVQHMTVNVTDPPWFAGELKKSKFYGIVHIYNFSFPDAVQLFVPVSQLESFQTYIQSLSGISTELIRKPTRELAHTPQISRARENLDQFLKTENIQFHDPTIPVISNNGGQRLRTGEELKEAVLSIIDRPIDTVRTMNEIVRLNPDYMIEFGLGRKGQSILEKSRISVPYLSVETGDLADRGVLNTLSPFWIWWNRIRGNSIESREMVTRQAPWESYGLTVLAGMTVPVLMFFHLSPLWAGAWGAVWGLAHVAGTFDKRLNPIGGYEALWPSLAKAAVGTLWVALYAWGLEGLLSYSPLAEAMARLALFDGSGSLFLSPVLGFIPKWTHRLINTLAIKRTPLSFYLADFSGRSLPWSWIQFIVRTGRIEKLIDRGWPKIFPEYVYYLGRRTGLIYQHYTNPGRLRSVDVLMNHLGLLTQDKPDGKPLIFEIGPGYPAVTSYEMAEMTGGHVVTFERGGLKYLVAIAAGAADAAFPLYALFNNRAQVLSLWRQNIGWTHFQIFLTARRALLNFISNQQQPRIGRVIEDPTPEIEGRQEEVEHRSGDLFEGLEAEGLGQADAIRMANVLWFQDKEGESRAINRLSKYLRPGGRAYIVDGSEGLMELLVYQKRAGHLVPEYYGLSWNTGNEVLFKKNVGTDRHGRRGWLFDPFERHRRAVSVATKRSVSSPQGWSPESVVTELGQNYPEAINVGNIYLFPLVSPIEKVMPSPTEAPLPQSRNQMDLTAPEAIGFGKDILVQAFSKVRNQLIAQGRPDGKPYFPYLYESREREFVIESDGIKIVLVDVTERQAFDPPQPLSDFNPPPRNIREIHPDGHCLFCRLLENNSPEFFASVRGTGNNSYRATVNLGEYGYPHFQFIAEDPVPNLYDQDNRFLDFLRSAWALGPDFSVIINGAFSGASQRHLHWHGIKTKVGGLWAYVDSLSPPDPSASLSREELSGYPGQPILFRGNSIGNLAETITKEIHGLYDKKISAGVFARVKPEGRFEVVVAPTRGERMVSWDVIFSGSDELFDHERQTVKRFNLYGYQDPIIDPLTDGMGAAHIPGGVPNLLTELPSGFRENKEWQTQTAKRLILLFGDYNPNLIDSARLEPPISSAQTPLTRRIWMGLSKFFPIEWENPIKAEARFTAIWESAFYWVLPSLLVSLLAGMGWIPPSVSVDRLIPALVPLWGLFFYFSHDERGRPLERVTLYLTVMYGLGAMILSWGGGFTFLGTVLVGLGLAGHTRHDETALLYRNPSGLLNYLEKIREANLLFGVDRAEVLNEILANLGQDPLVPLGVGEKFISPESIGWAVGNSLADQAQRPTFASELKKALMVRGIEVGNRQDLAAYFASLIPGRVHLFFAARSDEVTADQWESLSLSVHSRYQPGEVLFIIPGDADQSLRKILGKYNLSSYVEEAPAKAYIRSSGQGQWVLPIVEEGRQVQGALAGRPLVTMYASPGVSFESRGVESANLKDAAHAVKKLLDALGALPFQRTRLELIDILTRLVQSAA